MPVDGMMVTDADNGKTFQVDDGETVWVRLHENSSTGYRWDFDNLDEKMVHAERATYERASDAVGSGGEATWAVKPQAQGTAKVRMKLWRQWEGDDSVVDRFSFTLKVADKVVEKVPDKMTDKVADTCSDPDKAKAKTVKAATHQTSRSPNATPKPS